MQILESIKVHNQVQSEATKAEFSARLTWNYGYILTWLWCCVGEQRFHCWETGYYCRKGIEAQGLSSLETGQFECRISHWRLTAWNKLVLSIKFIACTPKVTNDWFIKLHYFSLPKFNVQNNIFIFISTYISFKLVNPWKSPLGNSAILFP